MHPLCMRSAPTAAPPLFCPRHDLYNAILVCLQYCAVQHQFDSMWKLSCMEGVQFGEPEDMLSQNSHQSRHVTDHDQPVPSSNFT